MWTRKKVDSKKRPPIELDVLDESLQLLKSTTAEVSQAAIHASLALEERLKFSEKRFYSVIDSVADVVIIKDCKDRWTTLNTAGQRMFDWYHGEYYLKTSRQLADEYPPLAKELLLGAESDEAVWKIGQPMRYEADITIKGRTGRIDIMKTPVFNPDKSRKEIIIICRDISESYEKNRRNKACFTALNAASDIIFILDRYGKVFFCNDQFVEFFDFQSYHSVIGNPINAILNLKTYSEMWQTITDNIIYNVVYQGYSLSVLPMMNGEETPIFYIGTMKPIIKQ